MITEDYVSFEVAKLLKEKGFDWACIGYYVYDEPDDVKYSFLCETNSIWESRCCSAPTLQMAMKWLREVHKLYIEITPSSKTNEFIVDSYRIDIVTKTFDTIYVSSGYDTYEQACEAAIKYCLENLI